MSRVKRSFPAGTFIPTPARILAIVQLCLALSLLLWHAAQPIMGDLFSYKSRLLLLQTVTGQGPLAEKAAKDFGDAYSQRLHRNRERFAQLPHQTKELLGELHSQWQAPLQLPWWQQIARALRHVAFGIPAWELVWIFLSIALALLLLLKIEGAVYACWLLPFVVLCYGVESYLYPPSHSLSPDEQLFPSEEKIFSEYLQQAPTSSLLGQQDQLKKGWDLYLVQEWAPPCETLADCIDPKEYPMRVEAGEFAFHVARLELMALYPPRPASSEQQIPLIALYFVWNLFFAWRMTAIMRRENYL